jgi:hypothetical protein
MPIDVNEFDEQIDSKGFVLLSMLSKYVVLEQRKSKRHGSQVSSILLFMSFLASVLLDSTSTLNNLLHQIRRSSSALTLHDPLFITNR